MAVSDRLRSKGSKLAHFRPRCWLMAGMALLLGLLLAACSNRGSIQIYPDSADVGSVQRLLVASVREPTTGSAVLSGARARELNFFDFSVSVPPDRLPGTVQFANNPPPDPTTDFATVSAGQLADIGAFRRGIDRLIAEGASAKGEVVVFVHGYNVNFAEGLYRQAQLAHDFDSDSISVNFSWASAGSARAYAFDRESALVARDALENVLQTIQQSRAQRIVVIAHSMGGQLAMETLRQMAIRSAPGTFDKLASIVLVAPDIDVDVFLGQASVVAAKDVPIYIFVSSRDRALRLSSLLRGRNARVGLVTDAAAFEGLPVAVIDTTDFDANGDPLQHFKAATSPTMIALLSGNGTAGLQQFAQAETRPGLIQGSVEAIQDAANTVIGGR